MQEKIRNCIKHYHEYHGTKWVLLGGDDRIVPMRYCKSPYDPNALVPADMYYADVNEGTWDEDSDGIYGELDDIDQTHLTPEVYLGRLPAFEPNEVTGYINKVITYETANPNGFSHSMLFVCGGPDGDRPSGDARPEDFRDHDPVDGGEGYRRYYREQIQPYWQAVPADGLFGSYTSWDTSVCGDFEANAKNLAEKINMGYHYITYSGHGWVWFLEKGTFGPNQIRGLTNPIPCMVRSGGCSAAAFDDAYPGHQQTMMPEAFLLNPKGGAIIFCGYCRTAIGGGHQDALYEEMFKHGQRNIGMAFSQMKTRLAPSSVTNPYSQYIYLLLGDPAIDLLDEESGRKLHIDSPAGCEVIDINDKITIRWSACGNGFSTGERAKLEYSDDAGISWYQVPGAEQLNYDARFFVWERPGLAEGSEYRVRVVSVSDPSCLASSRTSFTVHPLRLLTVKSSPSKNLKITGTQPNYTDYTFTVKLGDRVTITAPASVGGPPSNNGCPFVRWVASSDLEVQKGQTCSFVMTEDIRVAAEYEFPEPTTSYYVNDEIAENDVAAGNDLNDGRGPQTPMRHIMSLLAKYPNIGGGEVVKVSAGMYHENLVLDHNHFGLKIEGAGPELAIIDGSSLGSCLTIDAATTEFTWTDLEGLTFQNGAALYGGAICSLNEGQSNVTCIKNCVFAHNHAAYDGGAIIASNNTYTRVSDSGFIDNVADGTGTLYARAGAYLEIEGCHFERNGGRNGGAVASAHTGTTVDIRDTQFVENFALTHGGAVYNFLDAHACISNCVFDKNSATYGGAIRNTHACVLRVSGSSFSENNSVRYGAVYNSDQGTVDIDRCTFIHNSSGFRGAAVVNDGGTATNITQSAFIGNKSLSDGGAIFHCGKANMAINSTLFAGNFSPVVAGAICANEYSTSKIANCTFSGNKSPTSATCISLGWNAVMEISGSVIHGNLPSDHPHIRLTTSAILKLKYSDIEGGSSSILKNGSAVLEYGPGNIEEDPLFVKEGLWDANGTPSDTKDDLWVDGDYHLSSHSPCIDAGDPNYLYCLGDQDIDGEPRVMGLRIDIGADEVGTLRGRH